MRLEQISLYGPKVSSGERTYLLVGDLESLSATALYSEGKNFVKKDGTLETVLPNFIGKDSVKIYINPLTGRVDAGYQKAGESHRDYSNSGRTINLDKGSGS